MADKPKTFVLSDETVNSYGYTVKTSGIRLDRFKLNPIMLYQHDENNHPIGRWENIRVQGLKLLADAVFDMNDPLGKMVADKVANGFLNAVSITADVVSEARSGDIVESCELREASIVTFPGNPNAIRLSSTLPGKTGKQVTCYFNMRLSSDKNQSIQNRLISLLKLDKSSNDEAIYNAIENLAKQIDQVKKEQDEEAESLTALALKYEIIPPSLKRVQLMAFKQNFPESKKELQELIAEKTEKIRQGATHIALKEVILGGKRSETSNAREKSEWTLDDYRKKAPDELANDPELFNKLITLKYKK